MTACSSCDVDTAAHACECAHDPVLLLPVETLRAITLAKLRGDAAEVNRLKTAGLAALRAARTDSQPVEEHMSQNRRDQASAAAVAAARAQMIVNARARTRFNQETGRYVELPSDPIADAQARADADSRFADQVRERTWRREGLL